MSRHGYMTRIVAGVKSHLKFTKTYANRWRAFRAQDHGTQRFNLCSALKIQFFYIDTVEKRNGEERIFLLCRLRYLNANWSLALFTWSNEQYEPCAFLTGKLEGSIEEALVSCDASVN